MPDRLTVKVQDSFGRLTVKLQILLADYRLTVKHVLDLLDL